MFLKNNWMDLDPESIPCHLRKGWEFENCGGHTSLASLRGSSIKALKHLVKLTILLTLFAIVFLSFLGHAHELSLFSKLWWYMVLCILAVACIFWVVAYRYLLPPLSVEMLRHFIHDYNALMKLLNQEWKYQYRYPTGGPGTQPEFTHVESFVREKLISMAEKIKALENPKADWGDCFGGHEDPKELRREFARAFDILRPFGLVYPDYGPYFHPEGSHFYG